MTAEAYQEINVPIAELETALRSVKDAGPKVEVAVEGVTVKDLRPIGKTFWFEYHCWESPKSGDAEVWYHSHQQVEVLGFAECEPASFITFEERGEAGAQLVYRVRFKDGLEWDVFEDELLDSPEEFSRPDPGKTLGSRH